MKLKACRSLLSSVYFAPDQIRTCCKRFHNDNIVKGDAVLFENSSSKNISDVSITDIIDRKLEMIDEINSENFDCSHQCFGCPWITEISDTENTDISIDHISFEMHSVCNMRCTYCSDTYYGGLRSPYDTDSLLLALEKYILARSSLAPISIVFGGGEPVLFNDFDKLLEFSQKYSSDIIVFTNSTIYSDTIQSSIDSNNISIITSIDAGDSDLFKQIRQLDAFDRVLSNLSRYSSINPLQVTIKYIFTENNSSKSDIEKFLHKIEEHNLYRCNFQISSDFKSSSLSHQQVETISFLKFSLKNRFSSRVFVDDHLAPRLLASIDYNSAIDSLPYIVWGCGEHSKRIFERIGVSKVRFFIDRDPSVSNFMGLEVKRPEALNQLSSKDRVFIATAYSYNSVYSQFKNLDLDHILISDPY